MPRYNGATADMLWLNGQDEAAIDLYKQPSAGGRPLGLARIYAAMGRYAEAADSLQQSDANNYPRGALAKAVRLLRTAPTAAASPRSPPHLGEPGFVHLYVGAPERVLELYYEENLDDLRPGVSANLIALLWHPTYAPVRKLELFKSLVRKYGLVDYWRARGWA